MTDLRHDAEPKPATGDDRSVTEESGAGYGNNAETGGTGSPSENDDRDSVTP